MRWVLYAIVMAGAACSGAGPVADAAPLEPAGAVAAPATSAVPNSSTAAPAPVLTTTTTVDPFQTFVAWMPGGLVDDFGDLLTALEGVRSVTVARTGTLHIIGSTDASGNVVDAPPDGFVIPVEAVVLDVSTYGSFVSAEVAEVFTALAPDELVLSAASARLRRLGVGGSIRFEGDIDLTVAAIVSDDVLGSTEVALTSVAGFVEDNTVSRFALVDASLTVEQLEGRLLSMLPPDSVVRVRSRDPDRSDSARAVQPQIVIKQEFGEFAYRPPKRGTRLVIDPAWVEQNIVSVRVPLLGTVRCHRRYLEQLNDVMQSLVDDGLEDVIDRQAFRGCWNPRFIAGTTRLSRHAFGVAADINFGNSLDGGDGSPVHPELLARMAAAGITSGHAWSSPDPGHFEFYSDLPIGGAG